MMMVRAGSAVDELMEQLFLLSVVIFWLMVETLIMKTPTGWSWLSQKDFFFVGSSVSGGGSGLLSCREVLQAAWPHAKPIRKHCCKRLPTVHLLPWVGPGWLGHFVRWFTTVLNMDLQLIGEAYWVMKRPQQWDRCLPSLQIGMRKTSQLPRWKLPPTFENIKIRHGGYLVDKILIPPDKGTGKVVPLSMRWNWYAVGALLLPQYLNVVVCLQWKGLAWNSSNGLSAWDFTPGCTINPEWWRISILHLCF